MRRGTLVISIATVAILIGIGGYFGFLKYQEIKMAEEENKKAEAERKFIAETIQLVEPIVKNTAIRVQSCLKVEVENQKISWADYFELLKKNTDEIGENILKLKTIENEKNKAIVSKGLNFIEQSQFLLRSKSMEVKNRFEVSTSKKRMDENESEYLHGRSGSRDMYFKWYTKASDDYDKAKSKYAESKSELVTALNAAKLAARILEFDNKETILLINKHLFEYKLVELTPEEIKEIIPEVDDSTMQELLLLRGGNFGPKFDPTKSYQTLSAEKCAKAMTTDVSTIAKMGNFISVFLSEDGQTKVAGISPGAKVAVKSLIGSYYQIESDNGIKGWIASNWIDVD